MFFWQYELKFLKRKYFIICLFYIFNFIFHRLGCGINFVVFVTKLNVINFVTNTIERKYFKKLLVIQTILKQPEQVLYLKDNCFEVGFIFAFDQFTKFLPVR